MNRFFTLTIMLFLFGAGHVAAQNAGATSPGPRDLFNTYKDPSTGSASTAPTGAAANNNVVMTGRPGVRVRIELQRGGRVRWVSPKTTFQAGDRVRFHFNMNFPGYVAIINQGSSGTRSLLFPYAGLSNHVGLTKDYTVPQGEAWFEFDNTPGEEQLTFIMSKRAIQEITQINVGNTNAATQVTTAAPSTTPTAAPAQPEPATATPAAPPPSNANTTPANSSSSVTSSTPQTEEQEILAALNSRALTGGRDLKVVEQNDEGYVLASDASLAKPIGFKLTLRHR